MVQTAGHLTSEAVEAIMRRVLAEDDPAPIIFKGILHDYAFSPTRLEAERGNITAMIAELPDEFLASKGGGWTFLNLCMARDGRQWTGLHLVQERFLALAGGLGLASIMMPREMWEIFPGSMPYVHLRDEPMTQLPPTKADIKAIEEAALKASGVFKIGMRGVADREDALRALAVLASPTAVIALLAPPPLCGGKRDRLKDALEPFAEASNYLHPQLPDGGFTHDGIEVRHWRAARAALHSGETK
jgi:hypothetical protein